MERFVAYILVEKSINKHQFWQWMLIYFSSVKLPGLITIDDEFRQRWADWAVDFLSKPMSLDQIVNILVGDQFFDQNKRDIAALEREAGRSVMQLWTTDAIFIKYPHLRGLARDMEFEKAQAEKKKSKMTGKTK
jgi:hypothetical protein